MTLFSLLKEAYHTLRTRKYLAVFGMVVAAAGGSFAGALAAGIFSLIRLFLRQEPASTKGPLAQVGPVLQSELAALPAQDINRLLLVLGLAALLAVGMLLSFGAAVAVIGRAASSALIAGAAGQEHGHLSLRGSIQQGWRRIWPMTIILSIPPIPITVGAILSVMIAGVYLQALGADASPETLLAGVTARPVLLIGMGALNGLFLAASLALLFAQVFADRVCVLEGRGPRDAFTHGWAVARAHFRTAAGLAVLQVAAGLLLNSLLHLPGLLTPLACFLRPLAWVLDGLLIAFFSSAWTLAWKHWTVSEEQPEIESAG